MIYFLHPNFSKSKRFIISHFPLLKAVKFCFRDFSSQQHHFFLKFLFMPPIIIGYYGTCRRDKNYKVPRLLKQDIAETKFEL